MHRGTFITIFSISALVSSTCLMPIAMAKDMFKPTEEMSMLMSHVSPEESSSPQASQNCLSHCLAQAKPATSFPLSAPIPYTCASPACSSLSFFPFLAFNDDLLFSPVHSPPLVFLLSTIVLRQ